MTESVRRERLLARGREDQAEVRARLQRPDPAPDQPVDLEIVNEGPLAHVGAVFAGFMQGVLASLALTNLMSPSRAQPRWAQSRRALTSEAERTPSATIAR